MNFKKYISRENDTLDLVIQKILSNSKRTVLIESCNKKIIGIISEGDILRSLLQKKNLNSPAIKIMNKSFKYLLLKKDLNQARNFFIKYNVNILPVLNKEFKLIDVITLQDIF